MKLTLFYKKFNHLLQDVLNIKIQYKGTFKEWIKKNYLKRIEISRISKIGISTFNNHLFKINIKQKYNNPPESSKIRSNILLIILHNEEEDYNSFMFLNSMKLINIKLKMLREMEIVSIVHLLFVLIIKRMLI